MLMLCLSTSGPVASAALIKDGEVISVQRGERGLTHSQTIMDLAEQAMLTCGYAPHDMDAFAVDAGPGSFTGVRIGVCAVNAMAAAFKKPVVSVSSLEALLQGIHSGCALIDCRNGNGYAMVVENGCTVIPPSAVVISELLDTLPEDALIVGDGAILHKTAITAKLPNASFSDSNEVDADKIALVAWDKLIAGDIVDEAMPMYLRPSQAERLSKEKIK